MTVQELKVLIFAASLVALLITYLCSRQYDKTLKRMSISNPNERAQPHEDMYLVFIILILGSAGFVGLGFSIIFYFEK